MIKNKWSFYKKRGFDLRVPSKVNIKDYETVYQVYADTRNQAAVIWATAPKSEDPELKSIPKLEVGDIIKHQRLQEYYIFTPTGVWALVRVIK